MLQSLQKTYSKQRLLEYKSNSPTSHKYNAAMALQKRAYGLCANDNERFEELKKVRADPLHNGYLYFF